MKPPNACLPTRRLAQQLCVNHEQLGAVGDLMCKELLFGSIYSNNASTGLGFKNACRCVCTCITPLRSLKKKKLGACVQPQVQLLSASLVAGSRFKIHTLIAATGNCRLHVVSHGNWKDYSLMDIIKKTPACKDHIS